MSSFFNTLLGGLTGAGTAAEQQAFNSDITEQQNANQQGGGLTNSGNQLQSQFGNEYLNQTGLQQNYNQQADQAFGALQQTPGYTSQQAAAITGNPQAGFQYYNPSQLQGDVSQYQGALNTAAQQGQQELQAAPTNETNWQGGINSQLQQAGTGAVNQLQGAEGSAVQGYGSNLGAAINPANLTLTPAQMQNIQNVAAQTTAGQYQKEAQQAELTANAQGNTSPAAQAAIQNQLQQQGAIQAGNAASAAELGANQQQLAAQQALTGYQTQAATNLYGAQANAANTVYGAQSGTAQNLAATESAGNQAIANTQANAATQEANLGYNAAQTGGAQQIATNTGLQSTGQNLAVQANQAATGAATTIANQAITGQNTYRNYLTGEQGAAQTGASTAGSQQLGAYGGTTSAYGAQQGAVNNANAAAGNVAVGANSTSQNLTGSFLADGGDGDDAGGYGGGTYATIGENGPEAVISTPKGLSGLPDPSKDQTPVPDLSFKGYQSAINPEPVSSGSASLSVNYSPSSDTTVISPTVGGYLGGGDGGYDPTQATIDALQSGYQPIYDASNSQPTYGQNGMTVPGDPDQITDLDPNQQYGTATPEYSKPSKYAAVAKGLGNFVGNALMGGRNRFSNATGQTTQPSSQPASSSPSANPPSTWGAIGSGIANAITGGRYMADGGAVPSMRGDGSGVPGNEPGGAQGQYGWQGMAARNMAAGGPAGGSPAAPQYRPQGGSQMRVFTQPTNVMLGDGGTTDTVVPLNPGPNAKITPSQAGIGQQQGYSAYRPAQPQQTPPQAANQPQPQMPSRYRPATGPKGLVGPQMRPMQSTQYAQYGQ